MLSRTSTPATKAGRTAAALALLLLCAVAHATAAVGVESGDVLLANLIPGAAEPAHVQWRVLGAQYHPGTAPASAFNVAGEAFPSERLVRLRCGFGGDSGLPTDRPRAIEGDELLRNSDALLRAEVRLTLVNEWHGFVHADIGAADSEVRWQGLAGLHHRLGVDLLGGWRHVTYHFSPGRGFDSLEFKGPFLGAALAW
jgi:hypothetical protein